MPFQEPSEVRVTVWPFDVAAAPKFRLLSKLIVPIVARPQALNGPLPPSR